MAMRWNDDLSCYETQYMTFSHDDMEQRYAELEHRDGCYDCVNKDTCFEATMFGLPCGDWETDSDGDDDDARVSLSHH